jgi:thiamine-monophosphate kinase
VTQLISSKLANIGEFGLISRISAGVVTQSGVITGIGDDAAVTALSEGMQLLTSTDMLLENVHFRRVWHDPYRLGRKSLAVSISDIAAMGSHPRWALLSLAIPTDLSLEFIDDFVRGFLDVASEYGVVLIGGDTCKSRSGFIVSVTIMGEQFPCEIVRRSGAIVDDDIWVTGTLGDAALGLKLLDDNEISKFPLLKMAGETDRFLSRLLDPLPRVVAALALSGAGLVSAMIDISDGLLADFGHIAELSGTGGRLYLADLPLSTEFSKYTADLQLSPYQMALSGGEDYELCFTSRKDNREKIIACMKKSGIAVTRIGIVTSFSGVIAVNPDGTEYNNQKEGFNHFT